MHSRRDRALAATNWPVALAVVTLLACRGEGEVLDLGDGVAPASTGTCALEVVDAAPGLAITRTMTSDWEAGSCYELAVANPGDAPLTWWVIVAIDPAATVSDRWNHSAAELGGGFVEWRGITSSNNLELAPGATTLAGACLGC
ncbi:MAG: cellulose binding domain-containing protein [Nannocystaceae bacterium]